MFMCYGTPCTRGTYYIYPGARGHERLSEARSGVRMGEAVRQAFQGVLRQWGGQDQYYLPTPDLFFRIIQGLL